MPDTTDTPVYPLQPHERQKKRRLQYDITPPDFSRAADDLLKDEDIPLYARTVLAYLVESHKHFEAVNERNPGGMFSDVRKHLDWICDETGVCPHSGATSHQSESIPSPPPSTVSAVFSVVPNDDKQKDVES
ncbi:unnamed protein product [Cylicocyclus nassatus]|uniref:Uncharacterized protein n=1 Tax=Cylicocyclus nassatus TaxID=53992 RepID=A0AA36HG03_CYLNA|nr:unnamed protein product [Cylicocyclus nassatus]